MSYHHTLAMLKLIQILKCIFLFSRFDYRTHRELDKAFKPIENLTRPRLIKTHLSLALLPAKLWAKKAKVGMCVYNTI